MNKRIVLASRNLGKFKEFKEFFCKFSVDLIAQPEEIDVQETGSTFADNARIKAIEIANFTGEWALADDSGLCVDALFGRPGIHSARYAKTDKERVSKLLAELQASKTRSAYFICALCLAAPQKKTLLEVEGRCEGFISSAPRGERGFGYDPIFEKLGTGLTFAQMDPEQKKKISHRGNAFSSFEPLLEELLRKDY